ncbi:unnamed protein product [Paramecium sonneborni]|uniref:G domain-containing protein n=1 Tax=Paramecium sonneborni TaxID=65129 RepID=A0A8S1P6T7_9CILI|nr:unnamed protein product [Paramecium sonneborni]
MESVVLIGEIGSGKTTLFNKITNSNELTISGGESVTRNVFQKASFYGKGFKVNDTPGMGVLEDKIQHCAGILAALAESPVSRIIFVVKFDRTPLIAKKVMEITKAFQRFKPIITIAITHFDLSVQQANNKQDISNLILKQNIQSVIFISKFDSGEKICQEIDQILANSIKTDVILQDYEYLSHMDLVEYKNDPSQAEYDLELSSKSIQTEFQKIAHKIKNKIPQIETTDPDITNKMQALMDFIKNEGEKVVEKYLKEQDTIYEQLVLDNKEIIMILVHFRLKKALSIEIEDIVERAQNRIKINKYHCFNFIKKCNYCKKIWLKVEGSCTTYCGSVPQNKNDQMLQNEVAPQKYDVILKQDDVELKLNGKYVQQTESIQKLIQQKQKELKSQKNQIQLDRKERVVFKSPWGTTVILGEFGCGNKIDWRTMEPLTEGELKELLDPGLSDYYKAKDVEFKNEEMIKKYVLKAIDKQKQSIKRL